MIGEGGGGNVELSDLDLVRIGIRVGLEADSTELEGEVFWPVT